MQTDLHQSMRHLIDRSLAGELAPAGGLAPKEQQSLREHLHDCASCQKYAEDSRRAIAALGGFSFPADPGLQAKVHAALDLRVQRLQAAQPNRRRIAQVSITALLLTFVGSLAALQLGYPLAGLLHLEPAKTQAGVLALWVLPSFAFCLLLPVALLVSAHSAKTKGSVL